MDKKLAKSVSNGKIFGVCAGIAKYFNIQPFIIRLLWVAYATITGPLAVIVYIACVFMLPVEEVVINPKEEDNKEEQDPLEEEK